MRWHSQRVEAQRRSRAIELTAIRYCFGQFGKALHLGTEKRAEGNSTAWGGQPRSNSRIVLLSRVPRWASHCLYPSFYSSHILWRSWYAGSRVANNFSCRLKMSSAGQWMQTLAGRASAGLLWLRMCSTGRNKSWSWPCWSSGLIQVSGIARRCRVRQTNLSFLVHGGHPRMASLMLRYLPDYVELAESLP